MNLYMKVFLSTVKCLTIMVSYKWVALSNTTLGILMGSINGTIILISLPAIFNGIGLNPLDSFQYLLWVLFGYNIVTATLLVTFGRISDMFGRVRLYNLGFLVFTVGSILLSLTWGTGYTAATELVTFRIVQGIGGALLMTNSAAILTDSFPPNERGRALGLNQVAGLAGSLLGLILGGILATVNWRYVFLVSVPFGVIGTVWSYLKLKDLGMRRKGSAIDIPGNLTFGVGLILLLVGVTYGLVPYGTSTMGWGNPYVIVSILTGIVLLASFPIVESKVKDPMFRLDLFKTRVFSMASVATLLGAIAFGGVQIVLIILLQGIWLPLHGYSYQSTPFWAGVYMIPLMLGFVTFGPLSGTLSDKYGSRTLTTLGMLIVAISFVALSTLKYDFSYPEFALFIFLLGAGNGMFAAPNVAAIMNAVPPQYRGAASGMRSTFQNTGQTTSIAVFFTIIITSLAVGLPQAFSSALNSAGVPQLTPYFAHIPPTGALFAAFLGYNPVEAILKQVASIDPSVVNSIPQSTLNLITSKTWFPTVIAGPFMEALRDSFYLGIVLSLSASIVSYMRGNPVVYSEVDTIGTEVKKSS